MIEDFIEKYNEGLLAICDKCSRYTYHTDGFGCLYCKNQKTNDIVGVAIGIKKKLLLEESKEDNIKVLKIVFERMINENYDDLVKQAKTL